MLQYIIYTHLYVKKNREFSLDNLMNELSDTYGLVCSKDHILEIINNMVLTGKLKRSCGKYVVLYE